MLTKAPGVHAKAPAGRAEGPVGGDGLNDVVRVSVVAFAVVFDPGQDFSRGLFPGIQGLGAIGREAVGAQGGIPGVEDLLVVLPGDALKEVVQGLSGKGDLGFEEDGGRGKDHVEAQVGV